MDQQHLDESQEDRAHDETNRCPGRLQVSATTSPGPQASELPVFGPPVLLMAMPDLPTPSSMTFPPNHVCISSRTEPGQLYRTAA